MNCEQAQLHLNARLDGELAADDRAALELHLAGCAECQLLAGEMLIDEAVLREAFAGRGQVAAGVAERAIRELFSPAQADGVGHPPADWVVDSTALRDAGVGGVSRNRLRLGRWLTPILAAAAGFALAVMVFRPWSGKGSVAVDPQAATGPTMIQVAARPVPAGQLSLATGQVDVCKPGSSQWFICPTGGAIDAGMQVRTGPSIRCEMKMADGSEVRLNGKTQVTVHAPRSVEIAAGQVFSAVAHSPVGELFLVRAAPAEASMIALGTEFDVSCQADSKQAVLTVVEGSVKVQAAGKEDTFKAGEAVTVASGALQDRRQVAALMTATQWVDEILVMKGRDNAELGRRIDDLFAQLGHDKMWFMAAQEVWRLGDHCVVPLTRYIQSDRSKGPQEEHRRREAARIIADVATTSSVPELINLLPDADGEIRYHAARALERLTGQSLDRTPEQWRDQQWVSCMPTIAQWHQWWEKNKTNLPGCDPGGVKPIQVVKEPGEPKGKG